MSGSSVLRDFFSRKSTIFDLFRPIVVIFAQKRKKNELFFLIFPFFSFWVPAGPGDLTSQDLSLVYEWVHMSQGILLRCLHADHWQRLWFVTYLLIGWLVGGFLFYSMGQSKTIYSWAPAWNKLFVIWKLHVTDALSDNRDCDLHQLTVIPKTFP